MLPFYYGGKALQSKYDGMEKDRTDMNDRMEYLEKLLDYHEKYEPYQKTENPFSNAIVDLAKMEVLNHNKRDLERMLQNERSQREHEINRTRRTDHIL